MLASATVTSVSSALWPAVSSISQPRPVRSAPLAWVRRRVARPTDRAAPAVAFPARAVPCGGRLA
ncbi:hypothetical protein ACFSTC_02095 [Nonomuraea ferruginea]